MPEPAPIDLPRHLHFVLGLAAVCAVHRPPRGVSWAGDRSEGSERYLDTPENEEDTYDVWNAAVRGQGQDQDEDIPPGSGDEWLASLTHLLELDRDALPTDVDPADVAAAAGERDSWGDDVADKLARVCVQAALAPKRGRGGGSEGGGEGVASGSGAKGKFLQFASSASTSNKDTGTAGTETPPDVAYTPVARAAAHATLSLLGLDAGALLPRAEADMSASLVKVLDDGEDKVDEAREKQKHGWGGSLGRGLAIGAGVITGGVLIGVTGGLAAPAIAALLAPLGIGAALTATTAPIVLGTLFGLTGGGLAGWRVAERWRGVNEFGFVEIGAGSKPSKDEVEDVARRRAKEPAAEPDVPGEVLWEAPEDEDKAAAEAAARREVVRSRQELDDMLVQLSLDAGTGERASAESTPPPDEARSVSVEEKAKATHPSLTATIVVPGLLTVSRLEAVTAWRAICSPVGSPLYQARREKGAGTGEGTLAATRASGLRDGRDVYLLRYETATMLKTGREVESWVMGKLATLAQTEVIKRTVLSAYYVAVALPLSVYRLSTMALDNSWMHAQGRAVKAGRLLGEVLEARVQGQRPVVLIGTSVGALTVLHALLYLDSLPPKKAGSPKIVESAFLVSLPSAPTADEWAAARRVTARRLVNAWSGKDFVLAGVARLHEVVSRGVTGNNGICVAGLGPVTQPGVEDVDLCDVLGGHGEINAKADEILQVLEIDE